MPDKKTLYFVESIHELYQVDERPNDVENPPHSLGYAIDLEVFNGKDNQETWFEQRKFKDKPTFENGKPVKNGQFIYISEKEQFINAYKDERAKECVRENINLRKMLRLRSSEQEELIQGSISTQNRFAEHECTTVISYHLNVGCANCSLVLFQNDQEYMLWAVDAGIQRNQYSKTASFDNCMTDISLRTGVHRDKLRIGRFMLTHWHYDHISLINHIINNGWIDKKCLFFANLYYAYSSTTVNNVLSAINRLGALCVQPICSNGVGEMRILYPKLPVFKNAPATGFGPHLVAPNINNSSVVYSIQSRGNNMVFPGDLEQQGFDEMTSYHTCKPLWCRSTYYCISHHGSITGHTRINCCSIPSRSLYDCHTPLKKAILMGRNGAYSGIYSNQVLQDYAPILEMSEKANNALVMDWATANVSTI